MDNTVHQDDCVWKLKPIKKTYKWYKYLNIKQCPLCNAPVEVHDEE